MTGGNFWKRLGPTQGCRAIEEERYVNKQLKYQWAMATYVSYGLYPNFSFIVQLLGNYERKEQHMKQ
ncbi:hypothetical protein TNCV_1211711 [Trichonephila clavipes]|nr:hypothetical protein TNCV_1211711 [Trichonephila clavipes]